MMAICWPGVLPGAAQPPSCCRDPWQPLLNTRLNQKADLTSLDWRGRTVPFGCLVTTDEGALIFVLLEPWDAGGQPVLSVSSLHLAGISRACCPQASPRQGFQLH